MDKKERERAVGEHDGGSRAESSAMPRCKGGRTEEGEDGSGLSWVGLG